MKEIKMTSRTTSKWMSTKNDLKYLSKREDLLNIKYYIMKKISLKVLTTFLMGIAVLLSFSQCEHDQVSPQESNQIQAYQNQNGTNQIRTKVNICDCLNEQFELQELSDNEATALTFMLEEEKLARDVYLELSEKWNYRIFSNISQAEGRHMEATKCLIERYDLDDPIGDNEVGIFVNDDLTDLYEQLIEQGSQSLNSALKVGATIEDLDLNDLNNWIDGGTIDNKDVLAVFEQLARGSRNHLRAFIRMLNQFEGSYEPQYINTILYTEILEGEQELRGGICEGAFNCAYRSQNEQNNHGNGMAGSCLGNGNGSGNSNGQSNGSGQSNGNGQSNGSGTGNCPGGPCTGN